MDGLRLGTRDDIPPARLMTRTMENSMTLQILIGLMGTLSVIGIYYWFVRGKSNPE